LLLFHETLGRPKGARSVQCNDTLRDWVQVIRSEYFEMPGLSLTKPQARRLWGLDSATCNALIDEMVSAGFLRRTPDDSYVRYDVGNHLNEDDDAAISASL
jgi:hypothetical protein